MVFTIALTGGIASGKSLASDILKEQGAYIIDTDILSREVAVKGGFAYDDLAKAFPDCFEDGELNRRKLRDKVFNDSVQLDKLNGIMHPAIRVLTEQYLLNCTEQWAVVVAPLLFETGMDKYADVIINVACNEARRIERLMARDNIDRVAALKILNSQASDEVRITKSNYTVYNDGDKEQFRRDIIKVYNKILERAKLKL